MNQDWKIKSRSDLCAATGQPFVDEQSVYTALYTDDSEEGYTRRDYSVDGWEQTCADPTQPRAFSYWRGLYTAPKPAAPTDVVEKHTAESLLRKLIEEEDPATENARFILAVMLERKKLLKEKDSQNLGEARIRVYEHTKSGEVFIVRDPLLRLDEIDSVRDEVIRWLGGGPTATPTDKTSTVETTVENTVTETSSLTELSSTEAAELTSTEKATAAPTPLADI